MNKLIQAIKIEQKNAGLGDAEYRRLLREVGGVDSSTQLDVAGAKAVLTAIRRRGVAAKQTSFRGPSSKQESKIWALWYGLRDYLPEAERSYRYLLGFCRRAVGRTELCELADLDKKEMHQAIEALKQRLDQEAGTARGVTPAQTDGAGEEDSEVPF